MTIRKFKTTEHVRQVFFRQLINRIKNEEESCNLYADFNSIEELCPGFLYSQNFKGISVNSLFEFITYETRRRDESIYGMNTDDHSHFPNYLYGFSNSDLDQETMKFDEFPLLFDRIQESEHNDLIAVFLIQSLYLFNKQGAFLNFTRNPNLYDWGHINIRFIDERFLEIETYDENNGFNIDLYSFDDGVITLFELNSVELLKLMERKGVDWGFNNLNKNLLDDKEIAMLAFSKQNKNNTSRNDLGWLSSRLRDDNEVAEAAVAACILNYECLSDRLKANEELALKYIQIYPFNFDTVPDSFKSNRAFILRAIEAQPRIIDYIAPIFQEDREIVSLAAQTYPVAYAYYHSLAPPEVLSNKSNVIEIVSRVPMAIRHLNNELKNDKDVVERAIRKNAAAAEFIPILQADRQLAIQMTARNGEVIRYLKQFRTDERFAMECVSRYGLDLQYFDDSIRSKKHIVLEAIRQNNEAVLYVADSLMDDEAIKELFMQQSIKKQEEDSLFNGGSF
jgi:hypothetical protein